jgi:hypothetical protein
MNPTLRRVLALGAAALMAACALSAASAQAADRVVTPFNGKNLDGWVSKQPGSFGNWKVGIAKLDPADPSKLVVSPAPDAKGEMVNSPAHSVDIYTKQKFGDCTIALEVMVPKGSNSGIYVMGEYEIQVLDGYGKEDVNKGDMGALYGMAAPKVNASKKPGQWQQYVIEFVAPKFKDGKKVADAKLVKVTLNGQVIQQNLVIEHQTPGGVTGHEVPEGPLMFQGNHGAVAYRNIKITVK